MSAYPLILLDPADNVLVCATEVLAGDRLVIDGEALTAPEDIGLGHKVARRPIGAGEVVIKYGAPVGSMTAPAARGAHVHVHNMKSDYIPIHGRDAGEAA